MPGSPVTMKNCESLVLGPEFGEREVADLVGGLRELVGDGRAGSAGAVALRVTRLDDAGRVRDAVERQVVVEALLGEAHELGLALGGFLRSRAARRCRPCWSRGSRSWSSSVVELSLPAAVGQRDHGEDDDEGHEEEPEVTDRPHAPAPLRDLLLDLPARLAVLTLALTLRCLRHEGGFYREVHAESVRAGGRSAGTVEAVSLVVQKFGGTSVADPDRIRAVADHIVRDPPGRATTSWSWSRPWARRPTTWSGSPTTSRRARPAGRWTCCSPPGERISIALLCMAIIDLGVPRGRASPARQAGIVTDTDPQQGQDPRGPGRPAPRARSAAGNVAGGRRLPGRLDRPATSRRSAAAARTPPRSRSRPRSTPRSARSTPTCPASSPPTRASCPHARKLGARLASTRCSRWPRPAAGSSRCARSSSPATTGCPCTCGRASPGSPAPGSSRRTAAMEAGDHLGRHPRHVRGQGHDRARARPSRCRGAGCSALLADEAVNVDMIVQNVSSDGPHRHLVHRPARRPAPRP